MKAELRKLIQFHSSYVCPMSYEDYFNLMIELAKQSKCTRDQQNKVKNFITELNKKSSDNVDNTTTNVKDRKKVGEEVGGKPSSSEDLMKGSGQQCTVDPGPFINSPTRSLPAFGKVPFICRGDELLASSRIFLDVEKVSIRRKFAFEQHKQLASSIAVVNETGRLLFWALIHNLNVCQFNAALTGLTAKKLEKGLPFDMVHQFLKDYFKNKEIVGLSITEDLESLGFGEKAWCTSKLEKSMKLVELGDFFKDPKGQRISLGMLSEHFLDINIQVGSDLDGNQKVFHSAISDARMTLVAYRRMEKIKKMYPEITRFSCPVMDLIRENPGNNPKKQQKIIWDKCSCGFLQVGGKKKKKGTRAEFGGFKCPNMDDFVIGWD